MVREFHFGPLGRPVEFVSEIVPYDVQQSIDLPRLQRLWSDLSQQGGGLMIFQKRHVMPTAQLLIEPRGHGQEFPHRSVVRVQSQSGRHNRHH
jgi:hypothetical protein